MAKNKSLLLAACVFVTSFVVNVNVGAGPRAASRVALDPGTAIPDFYAFRNWNDPNNIVFTLNIMGVGDDPAGMSNGRRPGDDAVDFFTANITLTLHKILAQNRYAVSIAEFLASYSVFFDFTKSDLCSPQKDLRATL